MWIRHCYNKMHIFCFLVLKIGMLHKFSYLLCFEEQSKKKIQVLFCFIYIVLIDQIANFHLCLCLFYVLYVLYIYICCIFTYIYIYIYIYIEVYIYILIYIIYIVYICLYIIYNIYIYRSIYIYLYLYISYILYIYIGIYQYTFCRSIKVGLSPSKQNYFYLLQWKSVKNDKKCFLFNHKSSFLSQDI